MIEQELKHELEYNHVVHQNKKELKINDDNNNVNIINDQKNKIFIKSKIFQLKKDHDFTKYYCDFNFENDQDQYKRQELIFNGCAIVCQSTKGYFLKKLLKGLEKTHKILHFLFKPTGIFLSQMDDQNNMLMSLQLESDNFLNYYCPEPFYIPVETSKMRKKLDNVAKVGCLMTWKCMKYNEFYDENKNLYSKDSLQRYEFNNGNGNNNSSDSNNNDICHIEYGAKIISTFQFKVLISYLTTKKNDLRKKIRKELKNQKCSQRKKICEQNDSGGKYCIVFKKNHLNDLFIDLESTTIQNENENTNSNDIKKDTEDSCYSKIIMSSKIEDEIFIKMISILEETKLFTDSTVSIIFSNAKNEIYFSYMIGNLGKLHFLIGTMN
jgi:hypothetical protein